MISEREKGLYQIHLLVLTAGILVVFVVCYAALNFLRNISPAPDAYLKLAIVTAGALIAEGVNRPSAMRVSPGRRADRLSRSVTQRQWIWAIAALGFFMALSRDPRISRGFVVGFSAAMLPALFIGNRFGYRMLVNFLTRRSPHWRLRTMIVGPKGWHDTVDVAVRAMDDAFDIKPPLLIQPGDSLDSLCEQVSKHEIDLLVIPARIIPDTTVMDLLNLGDRQGFRCWVPLELSRRYGRRFDLQRIGGIDVLTPPAVPLANTFNRLTKRVFDIGFSVGVITTLLLPLMGFVCLIQRRYSRGPLFFKQDRVGENGKIFQVIKFRTMHIDNADEAKQACKGDARIYPFGDLLRKLSLDEFPQFLNVLRGEMSVVGPRPHMTSHERDFEAFFERYGMRRHVKPGVTGLAQVCGYRGEVQTRRDIRGRARYDLIYVKSWSILLDWVVVFRTAWQVIRPHRNAY
jgi:lipopolysaccharide/colanic/teichoic acid biosynthesis glycosyltransferase